MTTIKRRVFGGLRSYLLFLWVAVSFSQEESHKPPAHSHHKHDICQPHPYEGDTFARPYWATQFRQAGLHCGTDKVMGQPYSHSYEFLYGKYFAKDTFPVQGRTLRLLEIGLGCNMGYGPGKSVKLWKTWFPSIELHEMEYDAACVEKWKTEIMKLENTTVHVGDQGKPDDVRKVIESTKIKPGKEPWLIGENQFDVIIDDGGHYFEQIKNSYDILFVNALRPGGVYIIEDIAPMRINYPGREYNDGQVINWIQGMIATILGNAGQEPASRYNSDPMNMHAYQASWVASVEIQKNIVAIVKASTTECELKQAYCPSIQG